jgi:PTH1 family peptidyl-tRNA hydrolase
MKPQTYMNLSGEAVAMCSTFYKILPEDIIVIYDDVSLEVGQVRIRKAGSAGGHNGMKSIVGLLGTDKFPRVKIGVGEKPPGWDLANYVLGRFSEDEMKILGPRLNEVAKAVECMVNKNIDTAMNLYNVKISR